MYRKRYRIEATIKTLAKFTKLLADTPGVRVFIERVTPDANEEYYYVVLLGWDQHHKMLHNAGFTDSILRPLDPTH